MKRFFSYNYLQVALTTVIIFLMLPQITVAQQQSKYNVLFIVADDMNDHCSFLGNTEVIMPNLDKLAKRGMVFQKAYCQFPLCSPSRTSLLSGWRPDKTGIHDNAVRPSSILSPSVVFLPELFNNYGYRTERYGKIFHDQFEDDITWDYAEPPEKAFEKGDKSDGDWWISLTPASMSMDGIATNHLVRRMKQPQLQPFFYALGFNNPHDPFTPTLDYWNINGDSSVQELLPTDSTGRLTTTRGNGSGNIMLPATPEDDLADIPPVALTQRFPKTNLAWKKSVHAYNAEVTETDAQLGLVLDELDRQNLWANTIVIFLSDHGQHLGEHNGLWGKLTLFEETLHIPLIVCVPGKSPGVCTKLVEMVDIFPTLAELCQLPVEKGLEGSSFVRLLDNPNQPWKSAVFSQVFKADTTVKSVCTKQFRYTNWGIAGEELYDLITDPNEYTNLALNPDYATELKRMRKILEKGWTKAVPPCIKPKAKITFKGSLDICSSDRVLLTANGGGDFNYLWLQGTDTIAEANERNYIATEPGVYRVLVYTSKDCGRVSQPVTVISSCKKAMPEILILPNPVTGNCIVTYRSTATGNVQLKVYDKTGKLMLHETQLAVKGSNTFKLSLSQLINGMYSLQLNNGKEQSQTKFIKAN